MAQPIITLTTDFGLSDHYAGTMKGVILGIAPRAAIVDLSHDIRPYEITQGAYLISQAYRYFPKGTVHVAVVDPGVGSSRRPLLMEAAGHRFIGPDNGIFSMIFSREKHKVREITASRYFLSPVSRTFHGRDVFAPCAAHLAAGVRPAQFGKLIQDYLKPASERPIQTARRVWTGTVLHVDRFGNLVTNFTVSEFPDFTTRPFELSIGLVKIRRLALTFSECNPGEVFAISGSSGYLEIAVNQGSAARLLGCGPGAPVEFTVY
jgi:S-adenosylmethionine hydrolase